MIEANLDVPPLSPLPSAVPLYHELFLSWVPGTWDTPAGEKALSVSVQRILKVFSSL